MTDVTLPSLGESVTEGIITQWFKKVGDTVARDEPLFEVSTDKVDSEMPSPAAGVLTQILAEEGDTVETGSRVAVIDESGTRRRRTGRQSRRGHRAKNRCHAAPATTPVANVFSEASTRARAVSSSRRSCVGYLADGGVEPSTLQGSGPGGSITRRDAERAVLDGPTEEARRRRCPTVGVAWASTWPSRRRSRRMASSPSKPTAPSSPSSTRSDVRRATASRSATRCS